MHGSYQGGYFLFDPFLYTYPPDVYRPAPTRTYDLATNGYTCLTYIRCGPQSGPTFAHGAGDRYDIFSVRLESDRRFSFGLRPDATAFTAYCHRRGVDPNYWFQPDKWITIADFGEVAEGAWTCVALRVTAGTVECIQDGVVRARVPCPSGLLLDNLTDMECVIGGFYNIAFNGDIRAAAWYETAVADADMAQAQAIMTELPVLFDPSAAAAETSVAFTWAAQAAFQGNVTAVQVAVSADGGATWTTKPTIASPQALAT